MTMRTNDTVKQSRDHMTNLLKRRSVIALGAGVLTVMLSFYGITAGVIRTITVVGKGGFFSFAYFTMISNTLAALSATFTVPFAVEGIRKNRFILPRWIALIHYSATVSVTIMLFFVLCFISWVSPYDAFGGDNIVTHIFCPVLILISFLQTEHEYIYTIKDQLLGMIPFWLYMIVYLIEVILIGEENGGWYDIYYVNEYLPFYLAIPILLFFSFVISLIIRKFSNFLTNERRNKMFSFWKEDADPVEVRIEAYGLGVMIGLKGEKNNIQIPYDILEHLAEKYQLNADELTKPFMKGLLNGLKERKH